MIYFGNASASVVDPDGRSSSSTNISSLEANCAYGVSWTKEQSSPILTRVGNQELHRSLPIQSQYKGCVVDLATKQVNYWLDPNDWTKKADGTTSKLDGTDGDVMVHIPRFYGRSYINGTKYSVYISPFYIEGYQTIPECYVSAYHMCADNTTTSINFNTNKARSVANTNYLGGSRSSEAFASSSDQFQRLKGKPITSCSISNAELLCQNSNSDMHVLSYELYKWIFYWAYVIEYANFYCKLTFNSTLTSEGFHQGGLGSGLTTFTAKTADTTGTKRYHLYSYNRDNPVMPCGYLNNLGNNSGTKAITIPVTTAANCAINYGFDIPSTSLVACKYRGIENPFGDIYQILQGVVVADTTAAGASTPATTAEVYTQKDPNHYVNANGSTSTTLKTYTDNGYTSIGIRLNNSNNYVKEWNLGGFRDSNKKDGTNGAEIIAESSGTSSSNYKCAHSYSYSTSTSNSVTTVLNAGALRSFLVGGYACSGGRAGFGLSHSSSSAALSYTNCGFRAVLIA